MADTDEALPPDAAALREFALGARRPSARRWRFRRGRAPSAPAG